jgi:hypothetical protein
MASAAGVHCAAPVESGTEMHPEMGVPLSLNVTVPEGVAALPVSVAVQVIAWPDVDGLRVDPMKIPAKAPFKGTVMVWVNVPDVLVR